MKYKDEELEKNFLRHYEGNVLAPFSRFYFLFQTVMMFIFFILLIVKVSTDETK